MFKRMMQRSLDMPALSSLIQATEGHSRKRSEGKSLERKTSVATRT